MNVVSTVLAVASHHTCCVHIFAKKHKMIAEIWTNSAPATSLHRFAQPARCFDVILCASCPSLEHLESQFSAMNFAGCSVNFEFLNYTIITSRCKGPTYPPDACCGAFKEFACPYADVLNDLTNDCATTMFSYINLYGKYPPGLFAAECREGKLGLECPALPPSTLANESSGAQITFHGPLTLVPSVGSIILVFQVLFGLRL